MTRRRFYRWLPWLIAFGAPLIIYLLTLAPTIYNLDSAELTISAAKLGLMRATGYPLYILAGHLWSKLPLGDTGYRMNLFSALWGALTILLGAMLLRRLKIGWIAILAALGLLAVAPFFWGLSLVAEVYTLHTALMAGLILLLLYWAQAPSPKRLMMVAFLTGISLCNHMATVLLLPGMAWFVLTRAPRQALSPRSLALAGVGLIAGLLPYLYLPLRSTFPPIFNYAGHYDAAGTFYPRDFRQLENVWWLVSGQGFSGFMLAYSGDRLWPEIGHYLGQLWRAFWGIGLGPGLIGAFVLARRDWKLGGALALMFAANLIFYVSYGVLDKDTMFLPTYWVWAIWLGIGYQELFDWVRLHVDPAPDWIRQKLLPGIALAAVIFGLIQTWPIVDLSHDFSTRELGQDILNQVEPGALLVGYWDTIPVVQYLQLVEGQRPDVQAINRFLISEADLAILLQQQSAVRPVYLETSSTSPEEPHSGFKERFERVTTQPGGGK
jgi:hypothetical protein